MVKLICGLMTVILGVGFMQATASAQDEAPRLGYSSIERSAAGDKFMMSYTMPECIGGFSANGNIPWQSEVIITNLSDRVMNLMPYGMKGGLINPGESASYTTMWDFPDFGPEMFDFQFGTDPLASEDLRIRAPECAKHPHLKRWKSQVTSWYDYQVWRQHIG